LTVRLKTVDGEALICAAFLTYCGFYEQENRETLLAEWIDCINKSGFEISSDIQIEEILSSIE
jgi:dynein heavy chain 1